MNLCNKLAHTIYDVNFLTIADYFVHVFYRGTLSQKAVGHVTFDHRLGPPRILYK